MNLLYVPNYGERWRNGEAIAIEFMESMVNQVISKQFVKKTAEADRVCDRILLTVGEIAHCRT
ncbi:hypothetical protein A6769_16530 [Nostoc punctiforme NIES-2108]|uniref:Uncharacterized protein n=1 Tax=Nostoc punctiforme NIES-2108 TaxID=1356359 RepID=A0A367RIL9_NOSPU|nr:hypothetical protein A6769_16530 [Nostoc punctiforme NIES-2108]